MSGSVNIASYLVEMARRQPGVDALLSDVRREDDGKLVFRHTTFRELNERSDALAHGFGKLGIGVGTRVALCVKPGVDFFSVTFGLFKLGAVPVLIDPGIGVKNFGRCLARAEPSVFIGTPLAHALRRVLGWAKGTVGTCISTKGFGGIPLAKVAAMGAGVFEMSAGRDAAILFTSGSTGPAKGVRYTHENFDAQIQALRETYQIQPGEKDLATFPLFGLFGPALGMTTVLPKMNFTRPGFVEPREIIEPIQQLDITNMFGSPALVDRVSRYGEAHGVRLPSLKRVISAGAPASAPVLARFAKMLSPGAEIFTPYGATEALPVSSIGSGEILSQTRLQTEQGKGICIGRLVGNIRARIVAISDEPMAQMTESAMLPADAIGEIVVKGPQVTAEYFGDAEATRLAKTQNGDGGFYHRMGDLGYFDAAGRLWFCGRKSQRVRPDDGRGDLYTIPVEAIFNTHPEVRRSALVGVKASGRTLPVVWIELKEGVARGERERIKRELLALAGRFEHTAGIGHILFHDRFPVDIRHNAKINREKLAMLAQGKVL